MLADIPFIDISALFFEQTPDKSKVIQAIGDACRSKGFFCVYNHGIPRALIDNTFSELKRFFALPLAEKLKINYQQSHAYRGYFAIGEEKLDEYMGDLKEGVNIGYELAASDAAVVAKKPFHAPNQWPDNLPGWREQMEIYYQAMNALSHTLLRAIAVFLKVDEQYFINSQEPPLTSLRLLKYPPQPMCFETDQIGAGAHTDYGLITILAQDGVPCLQVHDPDTKEWVTVPSLKDVLVCNVGDMLQRWTNDLFTSAEHRVINYSGQERFSMPFFYNPHFDAMVSCLDSCQSSENPAHYAPIICGEYLMNKLNLTFPGVKGVA